MTKRKMLAALLAGLITLSLAGCGTDKTENTGSDPASTESGITATVTDNASEPTAESSLPAGMESTNDSTTEKEKESSTAPADSGKTEATDCTAKADRAAEGHGAAGNQTDRAVYEAHRTAAHRASCHRAAERLHRSRPYTHRVRGQSLCGKLYLQRLHLQMGRGIGVRMGCRLDGNAEDQP